MTTRGRPSIYTPELGKKICEAIASSTDSLQQICNDNPDFPVNKKTIHAWKLQHSDFCNLYTEAKQHQAELLAEQIIEICDSSEQDLLESEKGWIPNSARVARDRLRVDTRKWIACKLLPKVYGERQQVQQETTVKFEDKLKELE